MNRTRTYLFLARFVVSAGLISSVANATDHRMWREQTK